MDRAPASRLTALTAIALLVVATGCTTSQPPQGRPPTVSSPRSTGPQQCPDRAAVDAETGSPELRAPSAATQLFALFFAGYPVTKNEETKIAWRMTGDGPLRLTATGPQGQRTGPIWGPQPHIDSNWKRPGDEWGTGFRFTNEGCWTITATRNHFTAQIRVLVT